MQKALMMILVCTMSSVASADPAALKQQYQGLTNLQVSWEFTKALFSVSTDCSVTRGAQAYLIARGHLKAMTTAVEDFENNKGIEDVKANYRANTSNLEQSYADLELWAGPEADKECVEATDRFFSSLSVVTERTEVAIQGGKEAFDKFYSDAKSALVIDQKTNAPGPVYD